MKWPTAKTQRVILPRLFDAVLRLLMLLSMVTSADEAIAAFVLDFSDAFWQIPIRPEELRFLCAAAIIQGCRGFLVFLRAAQGSTTAPLLWAACRHWLCDLRSRASRQATSASCATCMTHWRL